ncbi:MAG: Asp-tRNA(Asn)/Glu-tRNA(Gln) amidotransferase subunit GatB [Ferruginibacter sp.]
MIPEKYELVVGLEVHAQMQTASKLFCGDATGFGAAPNTQVSPISLAHPGTLPVMNKMAISLAISLGLALDCRIAEEHFFARKNYFYPDLPKGYQVSQHTHPICLGGFLEIKTIDGSKKVLLNRIHMEEDAGKSLHGEGDNYTSIDLNRAGVPLLEIVTEPCIHSAEDAAEFLTSLRRLVRWLNVCDGNMEEGSLRCDANISLRPKGEDKLGTRVEIKNLNSIRFVKKAIEVETQRLARMLDSGETIIQQTRSYDAGTNSTTALRNKEEAEDYRYFPEPDLPQFFITPETIQAVKAGMPELPATLYNRLQKDFGLNDYDAAAICNDKEEAALYLELVHETAHYKACANWLLGPIKAYANIYQVPVKDFPVPPAVLAKLVNAVEEGSISFANASGKILTELINTGSTDPLDIAASADLLQANNDAALHTWIDEVMLAMPAEVAAYQKGKKNLLGVFAGAVKRKSQGKADMKKLGPLLEEKLNIIS